MFMTLSNWWAEQMREAVPSSLCLSRWALRPVLAVEVQDLLLLRLFLHSKGVRTALGQYDLGGTALSEALARVPKAQRDNLVLQVPPGLLLERELTLPLAAERNLEQVVGFEMDSLTPFRLDEIFWSCTPVRRDVARRQVHVRLVIVPRTSVQPILAALARAGVDPVRIEAGNVTGSSRSIALVRRPTHGRLGPRAEVLAMAGCGALAVAAAMLPFVLQSAAWSRIDARIEALRPDVDEARLLRGRLTSRTTTAGALTAERSQAGTMLRAIALLTDVLPDDTILTQLGMSQRKLAISGRSTGAARLIGAMAAHPLIHNPAFTAPVIRDDASGTEAFSISAELGE